MRMRAKLAGALLPLSVVAVVGPAVSASAIVQMNPISTDSGMLHAGYNTDVPSDANSFNTTFGTYLVPATGGYGACLDAGLFDQTTATQPGYYQSWGANYALQKYGATSDDNVAAALDFYLGWAQNGGLGLNSQQGTMDRAWTAFHTQGNWAPYVGAFDAAFAQIRDDVTRNAGPYMPSRPAMRAADTVAKTGVVNGVGIQSASGAWMGGLQVTVTLDGPAVFTTTGTNTVVVTTSESGPIDGLAWAATAPGTVKVSYATASNALAGDQYTVFPSPDNAHQRLAAPGSLVGVQGGDPIGFPVMVSVTPQVTTKTQQVVVAAGDSVADIVMMTGGLPSTDYSGTSSLYGPYQSAPAAGSTPDPALLVGGKAATWSGTTDASGALTATTSSVKVPAAGIYVWHETVNGQEGSNPVTGVFGQTPETTLAIAPTVVTKASSQVAIAGERIHDTVSVAGLVPTAPDGTPITYTLTGQRLTASPVDGKCDGVDWSKAMVAGTIPATPVTENGDLVVGEAVVDAAMCHTYAETLTATHGGTTVVTVVSKAGLPSETTLVSVPTWVTQTSTEVVEVGGSASDTLIASGTAGHKGQTDVLVYGPAPVPASGSCADVDWKAFTAGATPTVVAKDMMLDKGDGTYTTPAFTFATAGCYSFAETGFYVTPSGHVPVEHPAGQTHQVVLVKTPPPAPTPVPTPAPTPTVFRTGFADGDPGSGGVMGGATMVAAAAVLGGVALRRKTGR